MKGKNKFQHLCAPYQIGQVKLRNRIVKAPFCTVMSDKEGFVTDALISCNKTVAKGGVGLSIIEGTVVDPMGISGCPRLAAYDDKYIPGLTRLAKSIHKYKCPVILQLQHAGPAYSTGFYKGKKIIPQEIIKPVAASTLTSYDTPMPEKELPRGLIIPEIKIIENKFIQAAERAMKAGFDGIELHAAHYYLLNSFLSLAWNKRNDEYGGEIENRARIVTNIIRGIKQRTDDSFLVGVRINGREYGHPNGLTVEETQEISVFLQNEGADYLSISGWGFSAYKQLCNLPEQLLYPALPENASNLLPKFKKPGIFVEFAEKIKQKVSVPVIAVGRLNPKLGDWILENKKADLVAFARSLIADPEFPHKIESGKINDIAPCTACLTCWDSLEKGEHLRCRINPTIGKEKEFKINPAAKKKKVMIVGSGPAGMESARIAAIRGHTVKLYDKSNKIGGLLHLASLIKGCEVEDLMAIIRYYKNQLSKAGVQIHLREKVTRELIKKENPDVLILATGSKLVDPVIDGINEGNVLTSSALKQMAKLPLGILGARILGWLTKIWLPIGENVLVVGGSMQGLELAEFLIKRNKKVTIVEESDDLGNELPTINKTRLLEWMSLKKVAIHTGVKYERLTDKGIKLLTKNNNREFIKADTILVVSNPVRNRPLVEIAQEKVPELYTVGDFNKAGVIADAIEDGRRVALTL